LVWKQDYDVILWRHKQRTPNTNDYPMPLNEPPNEKFLRTPLSVHIFRTWILNIIEDDSNHKHLEYNSNE